MIQNRETNKQMSEIHQLQSADGNLQRDNVELQQTKQALQKKCTDLEQQVQELTEQLKKTNVVLQREIKSHKQIVQKTHVLRQALETMQVGVTITDTKRRIVYTNPADARLHGYTVKELIGQDVGIFAPPQRRRRMTLGEIASMRGWIRESTNIRKNGSQFPVYLMSALVQDDKGQPLAIITTCEDITIRKRSEEALSEERNLLRAIIDHIPDYIYLKDQNGRFLLSNTSHIKHLGAESAEELIGRTISDFFPKSLASQYVSDDQQVLQSGQALLEREETSLTRKGKSRAVLTTKVPLKNAQGSIVGLIGISRDITKRKQAQERIEHLNAVLNAIRNVNQLIVREKDQKQLIQTACDHLVKARGYASAWIFLLDRSERVVLVAGAGLGDDFEKVYQRLAKPDTYPSCVQRALNTPEQHILEYSEQDTANCCKGAICVNNKKIVVKLTYEGTLYGLLFVALPEDIVVNRDEYTLLEEIADDMAFALYNIEVEKRRQQAEKAVQDSEQWLASTLKNLSEAVVTTNDRGAVTFFNPVAETLTGWKQEEVIGEDVTFQVTPEEFASISTVSPEQSQPQITIILGDYTVLIAKDGTRIPIEYSGNPIIDEQGQFIGFVMIFKDVTERRQMESALEEERTSLAQKVKERTSELSSMNELLQQEIVERKYAQMELEEAKESAESANRAKSEFLANMSHELRTPLNAILGYAQIIKNTSDLNERQENGLEIIKNSGTHLLNLINEILDLSKIEAGRMELNLTAVHLPDFLKQIAEMIQVRAKQKGIEFMYNQDQNLPTAVRVDEKRLRQILINLLGNAVKFTEHGRVTFRVKGVAIEKSEDQNTQSLIHNDQSTIHFEVEDTGIGIAQEQLEEIFLPFQQVGEKRHSVEGTGLGLTISMKLIRLMKSKLVVDSTLGQGSVFQFDLALEEISDFSPPVKRQQRKILGYVGERRTVLVVDDRKENRLVLRDMLSPLEFKIIEAQNGQECIDQMFQHQPDATLLDLRMPVMNGIEAVTYIRKDRNFRDNVIIAVSASAYADDQRRSLEAGCNDFLVKPILFEDLLDLLQKYLPLEWIYDEQETSALPRDSEVAPSSSLLTLSEEDKDALLKYASTGRVKPLLEYLDTLEAEYQPATEEIRQLAKRFQLKVIVEKLQSVKDSV